MMKTRPDDIRRCLTAILALPIILTLICGMTLVGCCRCDLEAPVKISDDYLPEPQIKFEPRQYLCYRTSDSIKIDGRLNDQGWNQSPWTDYFVDIQGEGKPAPRFKTRVKMLWDDQYFYIAGEMEEPDVWGTLTERDAVIYHDNDFEVFIDPDGDTHEYYELEVNALGTEWDLFLIKPYRDGGPAVNAWDIQGLRTAVIIDGTINKPGDTDRGWSIEIAIPWEVLGQCAHKETPPGNGDQWRVNFSRVEWQTKIEKGKYLKLTNPQTGENLPEDNWVWSPQGLINMHYPEMWGFVQFSEKSGGGEKDRFVPDPVKNAQWALRKLYYKQRTHKMQYGEYTADIARLEMGIIEADNFSWPPKISCTSTMFEAYIESADKNQQLYISQDGQTWEQRLE